MKNHFVGILVTALAYLFHHAGYPAYSQEPFSFVNTAPDALRLVEKENLRVRENGEYRRYVYRERRGVFTLESVDGETSRYQGRLYVLEDQREGRAQAKRVDDVAEIRLILGSAGGYLNDGEGDHPRVRDFPVFPAQETKPGDSWRAFGQRIVDGRGDGRLTRTTIYAEYRYHGVEEYYGRLVHVVRAQYAARYRGGDDPFGDPELVELSGKHLVTILIDVARPESMFVRNQMNEVYRYRNNATVSYEGFTLRWTNWGAPLDRTATRIAIDREIDEEGLADVRVEEREDGIALSVEAIRFIADTARFLPAEAQRLDSLAEILRRVVNGSFLIVGHTADVGLAESQYALSVERAVAFVDAMIARGLSPDRFIYAGRGGEEPVAPNDTEENMARNRRVEIIIIED